MVELDNARDGRLGRELGYKQGHAGDIYTASRSKEKGLQLEPGVEAMMVLLQAYLLNTDGQENLSTCHSISTLPDFPTSEVYGFDEAIK